MPFICAQVNGVLVNGKSAEEIQQMLDGCRNRVLLEVVRCRRMTPTTSDVSQSSPFPTPTSPVTADEFDPPSASVTDMKNRRDNQPAFLHSDASGVFDKTNKLSTKHLNTSEPDMVSSGDSCSQLGRIKENKPNFLDKAVHAITRPFLRSRQLRVTRDAHSKSAFVYVGNLNTVVDDLAVVGSGQNFATAVSSLQSDFSAQKEKSQSLPRMKASDSVHGTWPKYHAHAAQRPTVLPLSTGKPSSSIDDERPLLPKPVHQCIDIQRSESARHHRPQISDSVVDYVRHVDSRCSGQKSSTDMDVAESPSALYKNVCTADSVTPLGPHYAKPFPDQTNETTVTVRISHFPGQYCDSEMVPYGGRTKYAQRPVPHTSSFGSTGQNLTENQSLHSSGVIISSPHGESQRPSVARYTVLTLMIRYDIQIALKN